MTHVLCAGGFSGLASLSSSARRDPSARPAAGPLRPGRRRRRDRRRTFQQRAPDTRRAAVHQCQRQRQRHEHRRQDGGGAGQQVGGAPPRHERSHALRAADPQPAPSLRWISTTPISASVTNRWMISRTVVNGWGSLGRGSIPFRHRGQLPTRRRRLRQQPCRQ